MAHVHFSSNILQLFESMQRPGRLTINFFPYYWDKCTEIIFTYYYNSLKNIYVPNCSPHSLILQGQAVLELEISTFGTPKCTKLSCQFYENLAIQRAICLIQ